MTFVAVQMMIDSLADRIHCNSVNKASAGSPTVVLCLNKSNPYVGMLYPAKAFQH